MPTTNQPTNYPNGTGHRCYYCQAEEHFVPGYLYTTDEGGKAFAAVRETVHTTTCQLPKQAQVVDNILSAIFN